MVSDSIVNAASIVITKVVEGPAPADDWALNGSGSIGSFSLPAEGGATTLALLLPDTSYTINEVVLPEYNSTIQCDDGSSGTSGVTLTAPGPDERVGCTFTNTYITQTLTVMKVVEGGPLSADDFDLFVDDNLVQNGVATNLPAGTYTVTESNVPPYITEFSGACDASGMVNLSSGQQSICLITNVYSPEQETYLPFIYR